MDINKIILTEPVVLKKSRASIMAGAYLANYATNPMVRRVKEATLSPQKLTDRTSGVGLSESKADIYL